MAQCVVVVGDTVVPSAADPCTGFLMLTPVEFGVVSNSPFNLTPEDGATVGGAILVVWATAFAARALVRALGGDTEIDQSN